MVRMFLCFSIFYIFTGRRGWAALAFFTQPGRTRTRATLKAFVISAELESQWLQPRFSTPALSGPSHVRSRPPTGRGCLAPGLPGAGPGRVCSGGSRPEQPGWGGPPGGVSSGGCPAPHKAADAQGAPAAASAGRRGGEAAPMLQSGHGRPALVGPPAGWQLGGGLVRGQLHHRACHRRVLQHGAGRGSGRANGRREGAVPVAAVPGSRQWVTVDVRGRSHSTPPSPVTAPSSISARLPGPYPGDLGSSSSSCHFLLMALLSCLTPVVREPGVRVNPSFQFGSVGDVNPQGSSLPPCVGSLWCDAPGSHCAFLR